MSMTHVFEKVHRLITLIYQYFKDFDNLTYECQSPAKNTTLM